MVAEILWRCRRMKSEEQEKTENDEKFLRFGVTLVVSATEITLFVDVVK